MVYKCSVCGYIFDEEKEGKSLLELGQCPVCKEPIDVFEPVESKEDPKKEEGAKGDIDLQYSAKTRKKDANYKYMKEIHDMAVSGETIIDAMGTEMSKIGRAHV